MKTSVSRKVFTFAGLILLLISLLMAVKLVQQKQENRSQATSPDTCGDSSTKGGKCFMYSNSLDRGASCQVGGNGLDGLVIGNKCLSNDSTKYRCCVPKKQCNADKSGYLTYSYSASSNSGTFKEEKCPIGEKCEVSGSTVVCKATTSAVTSVPTVAVKPKNPDPTPTLAITPTKTQSPELPEDPKESDLPKISFKFTFGGLKPGAMCMSGEDQVFTTIELSIGNNNKWIEVPFEEVAGEKNNYGDQVYKVADLELNEEEVGALGSNNFIKIRGRVYTAVKLCTNNQSAKAGESTVCSVKFDNTMLNFANYPLITGDITGDTTGQRNGIINGQDWAYIKARVEEEDGEEACSKEGDINFDGIINGSDIQILKNRLGTSDE